MVRKTVAIVGMGYVGIPLAVLCSRKGFSVVGYDIDGRKITSLKGGTLPIVEPTLMEGFQEENEKISFTTDIKEIEGADVVVLAVPTPVKERKPDLSYLIGATENVRTHLKEKALVIVESTISPGTCRQVVLPLLEEVGLRLDESVFVSHCPERINPGNMEWPLEKIPRVVGGLSAESVRKTSEFYEKILDAGIYETKTIEAAESAKIIENSFRDINIAFVNEIAKMMDVLGIDVQDVLDAAGTKPFGFMKFYPGCGVGGHCIPVDPYYLIDRAKKEGFTPKFMELARETNASMPAYTVERIGNILEERGDKINGMKIGILGVAFKGDIDDIREGPALEIIKLLEEKGATLLIYDPFVPGRSNGSLEEVLACSFVAVLTEHSSFKEIEFPEGVDVYDGKNVIGKEQVKGKYHGIGRG